MRRAPTVGDLGYQVSMISKDLRKKVLQLQQLSSEVMRIHQEMAVSSDGPGDVQLKMNEIFILKPPVLVSHVPHS